MVKIKAVGFDFDDTLVMSEKEKENVFTEIFAAKYGIKKEVRKEYQSLRGKANRREKIDLITEKLVGKKPSKREVNEFYNAFSAGYRYKMSLCPLVQCTNILKEVKEQTEFMFLLSLEEKRDVVASAEKCGLDAYFDEILGGPKPKIENFRHIVEEHGYQPDEVVYIGDSKGDIINAKKVGFKAIGIQKNATSQNLLKQLGADFTFSKLCYLPLDHLTHEHTYKKKLKGIEDK
ncbi:MAG: HAD-IA family hydrolase [Methanobacteriota archaeon]